ncbi:MAG: hypothetical protein NTY51_14530 [Deltaproteobacteria bacterium]|nr:hypothetical protein [Deltaproteobacteria bacterium]
MDNWRKTVLLWLLVITSAATVFCVGNFDTFSNPYLINDDTRQQIFWMERWRDPQLFQNDFLALYAESYVPVGLKAIYRIGCFWFNPLLLSNILTAILFIVTAGLWFAWGRVFGDDFTAFLVVIVYFLFSGFQGQMAGGLSRGFVFPLLIAYLLFVSQGKIFHAGLILLIQSLINPYVFLLCLLTHTLLMVTRFGPRLFPKTFQSMTNVCHVIRPSFVGASYESDQHSSLGSRSEEKPTEKILKTIKSLLVLNSPVILGVVFMFGNIVWYQSSTGHLISWVEMIGKSEYTEFGRYQLYPTPSFFHELIRPWIFNLSFPYWGPVAGWIMVCLAVTVYIFAVLNYKPVLKWEGLKGLLFIIPVSLILYAIARLFLVKLFIPRRYIFYTLNIIYCISFAVALRVLFEKIRTSRVKALGLILALLAFACVKGRHVEFYDFSEHHSLYKFLQTTPKNALTAGQPEIMDNVVTFAKRPAYVTFELSHTWIEPYWSAVKKRTFDLFRAYYSSNPEEIRCFCKSNHIKYMIVRSEDFDPERLKTSPAYFEPFNGFIWYLTNSTKYFAVLDKTIFPPIFEEKGVRVLRIE